MHKNEYYLDRITPQHKKHKFLRWLDANINAINSSESFTEQIDRIFDIDAAANKELDTTGYIVGRSRLLNFQPENGSPYMDDEMYRLLQKAKIGINNWDGTIPGMEELWRNIFPEYSVRIKDNQDMTMDVSILGNTSNLIKELTLRGYIIPKPLGVRINFKFIYTHEIYFGDIYVKPLGNYFTYTATPLPHLDRVYSLKQNVKMAINNTSILETILPESLNRGE